MPLLQVVTVFASCYFLLFRFTFGMNSRTKFTREPPGTVYARLGSDAMFQWEFTFGVQQDWKRFDQIIWGETDNNEHIRTKFITIKNNTRWWVNPNLSDSVKSRAGWSGNITQHRCQIVFILRNVTKSDEIITYGCTAEIYGEETLSGPIKLVLYEPPTITNRSNGTVDVEDGDTVTLRCDSSGDPKPSVSWFKDGKKLQSNNTTTTFQIANIELKDAGIYVCTATNPAGSVSHSVLVRVLRYRPHINKTASSNAFVKSWIGRVTTIKCAVDANPLANFTWFKDGRAILNGVYSTHDVSTLTLTPKTADDFGLYSCNATNNKGTMWYRITMEQLYPPSPPLIDKSTQDVLGFNVTWNTSRDNGGSQILDYKITLLYVNKSVLQQHSGIKGTGFTLQNLKQNRTYIFILQARNIVGYGEPANVSVSTLEADPPDPPYITAVSSVLSLNITWNSTAKENNIKILDYKLKVMDGITHKRVREYRKIIRTSLVIEKLKRNRTYVVVIQARNEVGYGGSANISARTLLPGPPDAPSITNITVDGKHCSLQWTMPYNGESPIEIYTLYIWVLMGTNGSHYKERLNTTATNYTLELDWAQNYTAAVSAWNKYGESSPAVEKHFRTGRVPQEVSSTAGTSTVVTSTTLASTDSPVITYTQEVASTVGTEVSRTEYPTVTQEVEKENSDNTRESRKGSFAYLAPLWIVILVFAVPATVFMIWKATKTLIVARCCKRGCRCRRPTELDKDSELGNTSSSLSTMEELKEGKAENEYDTITEILEVHFNHGHSIEVENGTGPGYPVTHYHVPESTSAYDHLYEQPIGPGSKPCKNVKETSFIDKLGKENGELKSGVGTFHNYYSHLGESLNRRQPPPSQTGFIVPPTPKWEISRDRLKIKRTIGHGEFGLVKKGCALNVSKHGGWIVVAVKTLKEDANESHRKDLLSELQVMKELAPHKHVVELLACITKSEPVCVITEFAPYGDLLGFLRKKRGFKDNYYNVEHLPKRSLTSRQLMRFAWEIADGMAYLSSVKIIHRDLAARNILLGENLTCKVTDFGMARDIHGQDMYQKNSGGRLPVKWTAIEALIHGRYTTKSDVWSFGVLLFEIVTIGGCPYPGMDVLELIEELESGYRMEKPRHLHDEVYAVMRSCWHDDPDRRLTFRQLHKALNKLDKEVQNCVNLTTYDGKLYENFQIQPK